MAYLWVAIAGAIIFAVSSFLPWVGVSFLGSTPLDLNMWVALLVVQDVEQLNVVTVMNMSLWLIPACVAAILTLALIQLVRRRIGKGLTIGMFILSLVPLIPLLWSLSTFRPLFQAVLGKEPSLGVIIVLPEIGYLLSLVGFLTVIVGSAIGFFGKKRRLNEV
ncbi:hypothetical protein ES703_94043 [subsurface metagenome]|nr:hypothetical protein [bacterium]TET23329.1 MAG: hypothetical protein E3J71_02920 [Candidatus Stahlbacteria bacterium]